MVTIEDLDDRTKRIEKNLNLVSDKILKQIDTIMKMEQKLGERFKELSELEVKIKDIGSFLRELDIRIRHFETVYKRKG